MVFSVVAGFLVDRGHALLALLAGLAAFCGGLAIVCIDLAPRLDPGDGSGEEDVGALPTLVFVTAALFGAGDAAANTVVLARLGSLADEVGVLPRETAFQYFQVANVAMTALAFLYAPATPLASTRFQPVFLVALAVCGGVGFCAGRWRRAQYS